MPTVPITDPRTPGLQNLPQTGSVRAAPSPVGASFSDASTDLARAGFSILARNEAKQARAAGQFKERLAFEQRLDAEAADKALTAFNIDMPAALHGTVGDDGAVRPGLFNREAADAAGVAADYTAREKEWFTSPGGAFNSLTPAQRELAQQAIAPYSARFRTEAVNHEHAQLAVQRGRSLAADAAAYADLAAKSVGTPDHAADLKAASERAALAAVKDGAARAPDGTLSFRSPADRALYDSEQARAFEALTLRDADYFHTAAANAPLDASGAAAADAALAQAESLTTNLTPGAAQKVREASLHVRSARESRATSADMAARRAQADAEAAEDKRLDKLAQTARLVNYADPDTLIKELTSSPNVTRASAHLEDLRQYQAAAQKDATRTADERAKLEADDTNRLTMTVLETGAWQDASGNLVRLSPEDAVTTAYQTFNAGTITAAQKDKIVEIAEREKDTRIAGLSAAAARDLLPKLPDAIEYDKATRAFTINPRQRPNQRQLTPDTDTAIDRPYTVRDTRKNRDLVEIQHIKLREAVDILNTVKERMAHDPRMTTEQGVALFKGLADGTLKEYDRAAITGHLRDNLARLNLVNANFRRKTAAARLQKAPPSKP